MAQSPIIFALFIDGDNVNNKEEQPILIPKIFEKINEYGNPIIKKVYLNRHSLSEHWEKIITEHVLKPEWIPNNTSRKNASDIALVIDTMELLYERPDIEGYCIVASDSDYTRLAAHIVAKNKFVLGIGETKTPSSFVNACSKFVYIEDLLSPPKPNKVSEPTKSGQAESYPLFDALLVQAYEYCAKDEDGWVLLNAVKEQMNLLDTDFRESELQNTKRLAEKVIAFSKAYPSGTLIVNEQLDENNRVFHSIYIDCDAFWFFEAYRQAPIREPGDWVSLTSIGQVLRNHPSYPDGYNYQGVKQKKKIVAKLSEIFPKTIKTKEKVNGKSALHIRVIGIPQ